MLWTHTNIALCCSLLSADERFDATFHTNVLVNASGYCQYIPPGILKSTCYIDVRWFPFDVQKCDLKFGSWTHNGWLLDLQMLDVDTSTYIPNGEWDLVGKWDRLSFAKFILKWNQTFRRNWRRFHICASPNGSGLANLLCQIHNFYTNDFTTPFGWL